ncbi:MAG TPA: nucleotidyltransferase domain-containing protein [Thermoplasmata archaeon]|nr:nucleotidyltransferase domain-containing protein [Thermoplasmata archaeon]
MCPRCKSRLWDKPKLRSVRLGTQLGIEDILTPHRAAILDLARRYGAKRLLVFGSVRRKEADARSDVDLLVEWKKGAPPLAGLDLTVELKNLLGRRVDLVEPERLHWSIRPHALAEATPL